MKKLLIILVLVVACSEDEPVFKIQDEFLVSRFDAFVEIAGNHDVTIPRNNLILRFVADDDINVNNSRHWKDGDQLYIDVDNKFIELHTVNSDRTKFVLYQLFAHSLVGTPYRDCGLMKQVITASDIPADPPMDYGAYPNLFDSSSPCIE